MSRHRRSPERLPRRRSSARTLPVGNGGCVDVPTLFAQSGLTFVSQSVNAKLVPEPTLR